MTTSSPSIEELTHRAREAGRTVSEEKEIAELEVAIATHVADVERLNKAIRDTRKKLDEKRSSPSEATIKHVNLRHQLKLLRERHAFATEQVVGLRSDAEKAQAAVDAEFGVTGISHEVLRNRTAHALATSSAVAEAEQLLAGLDEKIKATEAAFIAHARKHSIPLPEDTVLV